MIVCSGKAAQPHPQIIIFLLRVFSQNQANVLFVVAQRWIAGVISFSAKPRRNENGRYRLFPSISSSRRTMEKGSFIHSLLKERATVASFTAADREKKNVPLYNTHTQRETFIQFAEFMTSISLTFMCFLCLSQQANFAFASFLHVNNKITSRRVRTKYFTSDQDLALTFGLKIQKKLKWENSKSSFAARAPERQQAVKTTATRALFSAAPTAC